MTLDFTGLTPRPAQTWGDVRLVPLVRAEPIRDLRLDARAVGEVRSVPVGDRTHVVGYVPHAFVATWTPDASPAASYGTQLLHPHRPPETAEPTRGLSSGSVPRRTMPVGCDSSPWCWPWTGCLA